MAVLVWVCILQGSRPCPAPLPQVLAYYISLLKTLSLRLNQHTVHLFYNEVSQRRGLPHGRRTG